MHHIVWWEHGGRTVLENLLLLCPKHHHAIHDRHWELTGTAGDHTFRRPDGVIADPAAARLCGETAGPSRLAVADGPPPSPRRRRSRRSQH